MKTSLLNSLLIVTSIWFSCFDVNAQGTTPGKTSWTMNKTFSQKVFIENKGQFVNAENPSENKVLFGLSDEGNEMYFSSKGLTYKHIEVKRLSEKETEGLRKGKKEENEENEKDSREKIVTKAIPHFLHVEWLGANDNVAIVAENKVPDYYTYPNSADKSGKSSIKALAYKKILYKNLYNNIDVEYTFPENKEGIEYSLILHPGADISKVKMKYTDAKNIKADNNNIIIKSSYGDFIDHAPITFYKSGKSIPSSFVLTDNCVSFHLDNYDNTQTVIIDPWTIVPGFTSEDKAYDIEKDGVGNIYVYGGKNPYQVKKFTSTGTPIWTYVTAYTGWYGDLGVDPLGNSYISEGYNAVNSNPNFAKLDPNGNLLFNVMGPSSVEYWCLNFNCDYTQLSVSGGVGGGNISDMDLATGLPIGTVSLSSSEPRGMSKAPNGNFYCLTASSGELLSISPSFTVNYNISTGYSVSYSIPTLNTGYNTTDGGYNCITTDNNFVYTLDGVTIKKFNITNGALVGSVAIPGGSPTGNGGIILDNCANIYAGSTTGVYKFDNNLVQQSFASTTGAVYGLCMGVVVGEVFACGNGFVSAIDLTACPTALTLTTTSTPAGCGVLGSATVTVTGGTPAYSYLWSPGGQTTSTITGLNPGLYTVLVTDAVSCIPYTDTITVTGGGTGVVVVNPVAPVICTGSSVVLTASGSGTYTWAPATGLSATTGATVTASPAVTTTYTVTGVSGVCTSDTTVTVTVVSSLPISTTPSVSTICPGGSTVITASGATNYTWLPVTGLSSSTGATVTASPAVTTTYTVTGTSGTCTGDTTITINVVNTLMVITTPSSAVICAGGSSVITASGATNYSWLPVTGLSSATGATVTASPVTTTTYTVNGTSSTCSADTTITITVNPSPVVSVTPVAPSVFCPGDAVTITASGATTYSWSPATYLNTTIGATVISSPMVATTYTVTGTTAGCSDSTNVTVTINSNLVVNVTPTAAVICPAGNTVLTASGANTYSWLPALGLNITTGAVVIASPATTTTYTVTGTSSTCSDTATVIVTVAPPSFADAGLNDTICSGQTITLSGTGGTTYSWLPTTTLSNPFIANPVASPIVTTTYTVTVGNGGPCISTDAVTIMVYQSPVADAGPGATINVGDNTTLNGNGTGTLLWGISGLSCTQCPNPIVAPLQTTTYYLTVTDAHQCVSIDSVIVDVNTDFGLYVPTAFTPNEDGNNPVFMAQGFGLKEIEMSIYNRWGELLFYTNQYNKGWDGTYLGTVAEQDVYVYVINATPIKGRAFKRLGYVTLIK